MDKQDGFDEWARHFIQAFDEGSGVVPSPAAVVKKHVVYADEAGVSIPAPHRAPGRLSERNDAVAVASRPKVKA